MTIILYPATEELSSSTGTITDLQPFSSKAVRVSAVRVLGLVRASAARVLGLVRASAARVLGLVRASAARVLGLVRASAVWIQTVRALRVLSLREWALRVQSLRE